MHGDLSGRLASAHGINGSSGRRRAAAAGPRGRSQRRQAGPKRIGYSQNSPHAGVAVSLSCRVRLASESVASRWRSSSIVSRKLMQDSAARRGQCTSPQLGTAVAAAAPAATAMRHP